MLKKKIPLILPHVFFKSTVKYISLEYLLITKNIMIRETVV